MSKGTSLLLLLSLLLLAAIFTGPMILPQAHAGGYPSSPGLVCLNDSSHVPAPPADPCPSPSTPYTFNGPFPSAPQLAPSQVRVGVYINGSDRMDGFDITLLTNNAVLKPAGVDLTGTVLLGVPVILVECLNGVKVQGSACSPATDVLGTLHLAATSAIGQPNTLAPTTGL